ncbi:MAG: 50S ribosomal protein L18 [Alphaproteobacteria bacterium GM202ARS2]|nr:50S ribosomal protein L18 [Alphaproteobacteria bacterium GM202ARS2]
MSFAVHEHADHRRRRRQHERMRAQARRSGRLRLCIHRSQQHIYGQIIDDKKAQTVVAASSLDTTLRGEKASKKASGSNISAAQQVGQLLANRAKEKNIQAVILDRGSFAYHGRIKALADAAREGGLSF